MYLLNLLRPAMVFLFFVSCSKNSHCPDGERIDIVINKDSIYPGNKLVLSAVTSNINTYEWSGPGGWTSNLPAPQRLNIQQQDAGIYSVKVFNINKCLVFTGSKEIRISQPPVTPCSIPENTISSSLGGVGNFTFTYPTNVSAYTYGSTFYYYVSKGNDNVLFHFSGVSSPELGIYKTNGSFSPVADNVFIQIKTATTEYRSLGGDNIYVTMEGGQRKLTFCNVKMFSFSNPAFGFELTGKISIR